MLTPNLGQLSSVTPQGFVISFHVIVNELKSHLLVFQGRQMCQIFIASKCSDDTQSDEDEFCCEVGRFEFAPKVR